MSRASASIMTLEHEVEGSHQAFLLAGRFDVVVLLRRETLDLSREISEAAAPSTHRETLGDNA